MRHAAVMTTHHPAPGDPAASAPGAGPAPFELSSIEAERLTGGTWIGPARSAVIIGASIDSRAVTPGCLFACLPGARADGHDFAATAVGDGAALVLANRTVKVPVPVLVVADVARALGRIAGEFRRRFAHPACVWLGIAGANGKTTTKELIAAACAAGGRRVHATRGNLNNHLGVPLTLLATPADAEVCVIEIGANHQGEVAHLAALARPSIGVITGIGPEHLEGFGGLTGVARGESELFAALPVDGVALIGLHGMATHATVHGTSADELLAIVRSAAGARRLIAIGDGDRPGATATSRGSIAVEGAIERDGVRLVTAHGAARLALLGAHNLANACLAFHAALAAGIAPEAALRGLTRVAPVDGRLTPRRHPHGDHLILDDTYNANPASVVAGLHVLATHAGARLAVLGAMAELGEGSDDAHRHIGATAAGLAIPLIVVGEAALPIAAGYRAAGGTACVAAADRTAAATAALHLMSAAPTTVLVKASRSAGLEQVVRTLLAAP